MLQIALSDQEARSSCLRLMFLGSMRRFEAWFFAACQINVHVRENMYLSEDVHCSVSRDERRLGRSSMLSMPVGIRCKAAAGREVGY